MNSKLIAMLNFPANIDYRQGTSSGVLPEWALAMMWLGFWSRSVKPIDGGRSITHVAVPDRTLCAALAGVGALLYGSQNPRGSFSWTDLLSLKQGSEIFWSNGESRSSGIYQGQIERDGETFAHIFVTSSRPPANWMFSKTSFYEFVFTPERKPSHFRAKALGDALEFYGVACGHEVSEWGALPGAEARIATNKKVFWDDLSEIKIGIGGKDYDFSDLLIASRDDENRLSKIKMSPVSESSEHRFPLTILDGPRSFYQLRSIRQGNILLISSRTEYQASGEAQDLLGKIRSTALDFDAAQILEIPQLPCGMQPSSYVVR